MSKTDLKAGDHLELATAAIFQAHGYLVRRGLKLSSIAEASDATDADLLGMRFHLPIREERIVVDCRDRKRAKPFGRVLWTRGLAAFTNATPIVVTPRPFRALREFATRGGVEIISAEQIETAAAKLESRHGDADPIRAVRLAQASKGEQPEIRDLLLERARIRQLLVVGAPTTNFNRLVLIVRRLGEARDPGAPNWAWLREFVQGDAIVSACVMLLRFVEEAKWIPERDWHSTLTQRLTFGDVPPGKALELARIALNRAFHDGLPPPEYAEEVGGLVAHLIARPALAAWVPFAVDFLIAGPLACPVAAAEPLAIPAELRAESLGLARRVISTVRYAAGIPATNAVARPSGEATADRSNDANPPQPISETGERGGEPVYSLNYVVSRTNDYPVEVRTSGATCLDSVIASAKSQLATVRSLKPDVIGFYIADNAGKVVSRWYTDDEKNLVD